MTMSKATVKIVSLVVVWAIALSLGGFLHASQNESTSQENLRTWNDLLTGPAPPDLTVTLNVTISDIDCGKVELPLSFTASQNNEGATESFIIDTDVLDEWISGPTNGLVEGYFVDSSMLTLTLKNSAESNFLEGQSAIPLRFIFRETTGGRHI